MTSSIILNSILDFDGTDIILNLSPDLQFTHMVLWYIQKYSKLPVDMCLGQIDWFGSLRNNTSQAMEATNKENRRAVNHNNGTSILTRAVKSSQQNRMLKDFFYVPKAPINAVVPTGLNHHAAFVPISLDQVILLERSGHQPVFGIVESITNDSVVVMQFESHVTVEVDHYEGMFLPPIRTTKERTLFYKPSGIRTTITFAGLKMRICIFQYLVMRNNADLVYYVCEGSHSLP